MNRGKSKTTWWMPAVLLLCLASSAVAQQRARPATGGAAAGGAAAAAPAAPAMIQIQAVAADVCIPPDREAGATQCPANATRFGRNASTAPPSAARLTTDTPGANGKQVKQAPTVRLDEAQIRRRGNLQRRARDLLEREVQLTAQLARTTPRNAANRPDVLMRLTDNLQELASADNAAGQELEEGLFAARNAHNDARVAELTRTQQGYFTAARDHRAQLIRTFEVLVTDHPTYGRMDAVLFYLAFAYQDSQDMTNARRVYLELIRRYPTSPYLPNAYLSFAEFFFEQGLMAEAQQFYERVIEINTPENTVFGYALYKLAWVHYNLQNYDESLQAFYHVIDYARQNPQSPSNGPLLRSARQELITAYGAVYGTTAHPLNTGQALTTFRRYAENEDGAFEMLEKLGELYQDNGQWPNSIAVYRQLISERATSDKVCTWQGQIARAVVASRPRADQLVEVRRMTDIYDLYRGASSHRPEAARNSCRDAAARIIFDVASHWHLEAIGRSAEGAAQTRGTRDQATMTRAAELYTLLLDRFPDLDQVTFPDYNRTDWPTRYRIAYYLAEILRDQGNFRECGPAYDRVVELNPEGQYTEDAAYKAVLCYNDSFSADLDAASRQRPTRQATGTPTPAAGAARGRGGAAAPAAASEAERLAPRELNAYETNMLRAFTRYVCFAGNAAAAGQPAAPAAPAAPSNQPGSQAAPAQDLRQVLLTIKYRRAYMYYSTNQFEQAAVLFRDVAMSDPTVPDAENLREIAADLLLDSLNVMGGTWTPNRPACFTTMEQEVPRLKDRFCGESVRATHSDFCDRMDLLSCQIMRRRAQALHDRRDFFNAAQAYIGIVREHRECLRLPGFRADEVLYNAAIDYDAANMLGRAMRVRERMVQIYLRPPASGGAARGSQWAQRALYRLAGNYHAIQVFGRAADFYEEYADYVAAHRVEATAADAEAINQAANALRQATIFRIGLGEEPRALENAQKFARYFGADANRRRQAAAVVFSIGQIFQDRAARLARQTGGTSTERAAREAQIRSAWQDVVRHYTGFVNRYARNGTLDQQIQGNVALGRGYWNLHDQTNAGLYFRAASSAWGAQTGEGAARTAAPGEGRIREALSDQTPEAIAEAIEKSRDAVAEARFYLAEVIYERFKSRHMPPYRGGARTAAFNTWTERQLTPYIHTQQAYLQTDATPLYMEVISMHVPNWEIAAAARLADMFFEFAKIIRNAPMPPDFMGAGEPRETLRATYGAMIDERTQPLVDLARAGFEGCIRKATEVHWFNEWSQLCERSLNDIDRRRYPLADEVRAEPNLLFSRPANSRPFYQLQNTNEEEDSSSQGAASGGLGGTADTSDSSPQSGGASAPAPAAGANH